MESVSSLEFTEEQLRISQLFIRDNIMHWTHCTACQQDRDRCMELRTACAALLAQFERSELDQVIEKWLSDSIEILDAHMQGLTGLH